MLRHDVLARLVEHAGEREVAAAREMKMRDELMSALTDGVRGRKDASIGVSRDGFDANLRAHHIAHLEYRARGEETLLLRELHRRSFTATVRKNRRKR